MPRRPQDASPYQCFLCTFVGQEPPKLREHIERKHSRSNFFWCKWCGKVSQCLEEHMEHLEHEQCTDTFEHPCGFEGCGFSDAQPSVFISHLKTAHRENPFIPCAYCRQLFTVPPCLISHIQNECCNRPTSSSSSLQNVPKPSKIANSSYGSQESTVSSSTSKNDENNLNGNSSKKRNKRKSAVSPKKQQNESNSSFEKSLPVSAPTWNPFGLNKDFLSGYDSDSTESTLASQNQKSESVLSTPKKKQAGSFKGCKQPKISEDGNSAGVDKSISLQTENSSDKPIVETCNTWADWFHKIRKYKSSDEVEVLLNPKQNEHFFKCMQKKCTYSSHNNVGFTMHVLKSSNHKDQKQKCVYCFSSFVYNLSLVKHMVTEHSRRRWQCSCCFYRGSSNTHVKVHQRIAHAGEDAQVIHCEQVKAAGLERSHVALKLKEQRLYNCRVLGCSFNTLITKYFREHLSEQHNSTNYFSCCYCNFETTKAEQLVNHYRKHDFHDYECSYCSFGASALDDVLTHVCINHGDEKMHVFTRLLSSLPDFETGEQEGSNTVNHSSSPKSHSSKSTIPFVPSQNKPLVSSLRLLSDGSMSFHKKARDNSPSKINYKSFENTSLSDKSLSFEKHNESLETSSDSSATNAKHVGEDKLSDSALISCDYCDKTYIYEKAFKKHIKISHGINITVSRCLLCDFQTCIQSRMTCHMKANHLGETHNVQDSAANRISPKKCPEQQDSYFCVFCDVICTSSDEMLNHLLLELDYQKYQCEECDFKSSSDSDISRHCSLKHEKSVLSHSVVIEIQNYDEWIESYLNCHEFKSVGGGCVPKTCYSKNWTIKKQCPMCKVPFVNPTLLTAHLYRHLQYKPHHCMLCKTRFTTLDEAEDHSKYAHQTTKQKIIYNIIEKIERWTSDLVNSLSKALPNNAGTYLARETNVKEESKKMSATANKDDKESDKRRMKNDSQATKAKCSKDNDPPIEEGKIEDQTQKQKRSSMPECNTLDRNLVSPYNSPAKNNLFVSSIGKNNAYEPQEKHIDNQSEDDKSFTRAGTKRVMLSLNCESQSRSMGENNSSTSYFSGRILNELPEYSFSDLSDEDDFELPYIKECVSLVAPSKEDEDTVQLEELIVLGNIPEIEAKSLVERNSVCDKPSQVAPEMPDYSPGIMAQCAFKQTATISFSEGSGKTSDNSYKDSKTSPKSVKKQTARKSFSSCRRGISPGGDTSSPTERTKSRTLFKATARKSTSKSCQNLLKSVTKPNPRSDLRNVYFTSRVDFVKIYSSHFPYLFRQCTVRLIEFRSIM